MGSRHPPLKKKHKNIGFPRIIGQDPLKKHKAAKPAFKLGFNGTPAKGHLNV